MRIIGIFKEMRMGDSDLGVWWVMGGGIKIELCRKVLWVEIDG
jgi:hypothetical protein